jgi:alpha-D-ribose 1-methylphosphonate 5-triphosphate diphosphatase
MAKKHGVVLASHDDATSEHVTEAIGDGVAIAEFPTTVEAAAQSHAAGIHVLMGAPNVVRGGSHSGNVAATDLAHQGVLDILSSDYIPASLIMAAFALPDAVPTIDLAGAIRTVTLNPAIATGLTDRGEIAPGKRADLVRVAIAEGHPVVRAVWRQGRRVV